MEEREWGEIEAKITAAEAALEAAQAKLGEPAVMADRMRMTDASKSAAAAQAAVDKLYARWQELDQKRSPVA